MNEKQPIPTCFVVMPFSEVSGVASEAQWTQFYETVLEPAVTAAGYRCKRSRPTRGNIIAEIISDLWSADAVIADLTGQNLNVFYELGARHALRGRTIMITRRKKDIPSDLSNYAWHKYDSDSEGGRIALTSKVREFLEDISHNPHRRDNPVQDFLRDEHRQHLPWSNVSLPTAPQKDAYTRQVNRCNDALNRIKLGQIPIPAGMASYFQFFFSLVENNSEPERVRVFAFVPRLQDKEQIQSIASDDIFGDLQSLVEDGKLLLEYIVFFTSSPEMKNCGGEALLARYQRFASEIRVVLGDESRLSDADTRESIGLLENHRWALTHTWERYGEVLDPHLWVGDQDYERLKSQYERIRMCSRLYWTATGGLASARIGTD